MRFLTSIEESVIHSLQFKTLRLVEVVPLAGIEPALLAESDFESDASTSSATGATRVLYSGGCYGFPVPVFVYLQV